MIEVRLQGLQEAPIGAAFRLRYPADALELVGSESDWLGPLAPQGLGQTNDAIVVWTHDQANGWVALAAASAVKWPKADGILAKFTFTVLRGLGAGLSWPIVLEHQRVGRSLDDLAFYDPLGVAFETGLSIRPRIEKFGRNADGRLEFELKAEEGQAMVIEASSDLKHWVPLMALPRGMGLGQIRFKDPQAGQLDRRFYRIRATVPAGSAPPVAPGSGR